NFIPKLQEHFLRRFLKQEFDGDTHESFTPDDLNTIHIAGNTIYHVQLLKVNYLPNDVRCDSDTINRKTHPFDMVCSPEKDANSHPYWYAEVLAVFHATVTHTGPQARDPFTWCYMEFLWVHWLGMEPGLRSG
ncbi:hypothetical protein L208DRAFT_1527608, partial [Tricholoma matsutake]